VENVVKLAPLWRSQVDRLVIVDNSGEAYKNVGGLSEFADDVWRWTRNSGPPCRWAPALIDFDCDFVLFADDDVVPAKDAAEKLTAEAKRRDDAFSTIGGHGRNFVDGRYVYGDSPHGVCDMTVQLHLVRRDLLPYALLFREKLLSVGAGQLCSVHDDVMLCLGIKRKTGFPCVTIPGVVERELKDSLGVHNRPGHLEERNRILQLCRNMSCEWTTWDRAKTNPQ
jgi:hypothetical protein